MPRSRRCSAIDSHALRDRRRRSRSARGGRESGAVIAARTPFVPAPAAPSCSPLRYIEMCRFGRKKLPRKQAGSTIASCPMMSAVTAGVAVAVSASTGTPPNRRLRPAGSVRRPEVVPPLADAVGLVDGDETQVEAAERRARPRPRSPRAPRSRARTRRRQVARTRRWRSSELQRAKGTSRAMPTSVMAST